MYLCRMDRVTLLASTPLFESLSPDDLQALATRLEERTVEPGTTIFHQGEPGATMFLIQEGSVEIYLGQGRGKVALATLATGQYFGELSLLDGGARSATATTLKPTVLLGLDRDDFVDYVKSRPQVALSILAEMGERMRQTNELMTRTVSRNVVEEVEEKLTVGQRVADQVAEFGGSWGFIGLFAGLMALWMLINSVRAIAWDPMPFILLNLMLSTIAALQAPVIMMSQNRQAAKDKLLAQNDFQVNLKNELNIDSLLKGQAELLQRLTMLERLTAQSQASQTQTHTQTR
jgi:CRP/FNR family transcriptional regulator, cyclic AMP receptor protein